MPNFSDTVISVLKTQKVLVDDQTIEEGVFFPISPLLAYASFKKRVFTNFKNSKIFKVLNKPKELNNKIKELKGNALIAKEKLRAKSGKNSGSGDDASLYKLTPEQVEVMADIINKYGKELAVEINHFRVNVLAPYQLIKRIIRKNKSLTSTDITGMTKEEFNSSLESGRRKIGRRGEFFNKSQDLQNKLRDLDADVPRLQTEKTKLATGKDLDSGILEKVYASYKVGESNFGGHSLDALKKTHEELTRNYSSLNKYRIDKTSMSPAEVLDMLQKQRQLREKGYIIDKTSMSPAEVLDMLQKQRQLREKGLDTSIKDKEKKEGEVKEKKEGEVKEKKGSFAAAFSLYMLRRTIRESFKKTVDSNVYVKTYEKIIDDLIKDIRERRAVISKQFVELRKTIDFNDKENKIWQKHPSAPSEYTSDESHYYQKVKEEDFESPKYYERPEELQAAEREIENEIKRFERKLATIISAEDLARLKKYRLINNIITVSELKDPDELFKTQAELQAMKSMKISHEEHIAEKDYNEKLRDWASKELEDEAELESIKKQARELAQKMRNQGDGDIVEKYHDLLRQILGRKTLEARKISKEEKSVEGEEPMEKEEVKDDE